ncbi:hypothetical protein GGI08_009804, partial [Coemansia sp. S2]
WPECLGLPHPWYFVKHLKHPLLKYTLQVAYYWDPEDIGSFVFPCDLTTAQVTTFEPVYHTPHHHLNRHASRLTPLAFPAVPVPTSVLLGPPCKPWNECPCWMPIFIRAAKYHQAATEAAGALAK